MLIELFKVLSTEDSEIWAISQREQDLVLPTENNILVLSIKELSTEDSAVRLSAIFLRQQDCVQFTKAGKISAIY